MPSRLASGLLLIASVMLANPASASLITGSYAGHIDYSKTMFGNDYSQHGDPASGSFFIDTSYFSLQSGDGSSFSEFFAFNVDPDVHSMSIMRDTEYGPIGSDIGAQTIRLSRSGGRDYLYFSDYFPGGYGDAILLVGFAGSLFTDFSLDSILAGPIDLDRSHAYSGHFLEDAGNSGGFVAFDRIDMSVGSGPKDVPEPASIALAALALVAGALIRRKALRRRTAH